jgi:hypothetical protein
MQIAWQDHSEAIPASMNVVLYRYSVLAKTTLGMAVIHTPAWGSNVRNSWLS